MGKVEWLWNDVLNYRGWSGYRNSLNNLLGHDSRTNGLDSLFLWQLNLRWKIHLANFQLLLAYTSNRSQESFLVVQEIKMGLNWWLRPWNKSGEPLVVLRQPAEGSLKISFISVADRARRLYIE